MVDGRLMMMMGWKRQGLSLMRGWMDEYGTIL